MILLSLLFGFFMFKTKQGSAWTLHCRCVMSLSELPVSSIALCLPGSKNPHLITNWGPAAFTEAELEERQRSWKGKKATSEWRWQLTCAPEQEPTSPHSALHRAASRLHSLLSRLGLSAHEMLFTTLQGLLRAQPLQWVVSDRTCCFPSLFQDFATENLYWNVASDRQSCSYTSL